VQLLMNTRITKKIQDNKRKMKHKDTIFYIS